MTNLPPMTSLIFLRKLRCWTLYNTQFKLTAKPAIVYFDKKKNIKRKRGYIHIIFQCEHIGHVCRYLYTVLNFVFSRKNFWLKSFKHLSEAFKRRKQFFVKKKTTIFSGFLVAHQQSSYLVKKVFDEIITDYTKHRKIRHTLYWRWLTQLFDVPFSYSRARLYRYITAGLVSAFRQFSTWLYYSIHSLPLMIWPDSTTCSFSRRGARNPRGSPVGNIPEGIFFFMRIFSVNYNNSASYSH